MTDEERQQEVGPRLAAALRCVELAESGGVPWADPPALVLCAFRLTWCALQYHYRVKP